MSSVKSIAVSKNINVISTEEERIPLTADVFIGIIKEIHKKGLISNELYTRIGDFLCFWVCLSWSLILLLALLYYSTYRKTRRIRPPKKKIE